MRRKLQNSRGETLVETLAAILIASLSVALLFSCIMASTRMDENARAADKRYYEALSRAEEQTDKVTLTDAGGTEITTVQVVGNSNTQTIPIHFFGGESMYSYKEVTPVGP